MKAFHPLSETVFLESVGGNVDASLNGAGDVLRIIYRHQGTPGFVKAGIGSQVATDQDLPLIGAATGVIEYLHIDFKDDHVAILAPSGANAYITRGTLT